MGCKKTTYQNFSFLEVVHRKNATAFKKNRSYGDHLGNIRVRYALDPETNALAILEEKHYYPFGLQHEGYNQGNRRAFEVVNSKVELTPVNPFIGDSFKYGFGGKEYQDELDLNLYDVSARNYDPALGRWMNIDPLAEQMRRHSPYNFAFDNPVVFGDPDGMSPATELFNTKGIKIGEDAGGNDGNVSIVSNNIAKSVKKGKVSVDDAIAGGVQTTKTILTEALDVLQRAEDNGGLSEEASTVSKDGTIIRSETGSSETEMRDGVEVLTSEIINPGGEGNTSIHAHITEGVEKNADGTAGGITASAKEPGPLDPGVFSKFSQNIIVGRLGEITVTPKTMTKDAKINKPNLGVAIFGNKVTTNSTPLISLTKGAVKKIIK